jgi:hypothetical protein
VDRRALGVGIFLVAFVAAGVLTYQWFSDDGPWIRFSQSGGIAGVSIHLTVEEDGHATLVDDKKGSTHSFPVPSDQLAGLKRTADRVDWSQAEGRHLAVGFDLFQYTFEVDGHEAEGGLLTPEEKSLEPLLGTLTHVIQTAPD